VYVRQIMLHSNLHAIEKVSPPRYPNVVRYIKLEECVPHLVAFVV
jgi:hypothetical protein